MLVLTSAIWGFAFVAQSVGMEYVGPFTFNGVRCMIGALTLLPLVLVRHRRGADVHLQGKEQGKTLLIGSLVCGVLLCIASNLQQIGIMYTTVGKAGFITAMYIVLVPVLRIFAGKRANLTTWLSVLLACLGLYLLCMNGGFNFSAGDKYVILCAVFFAFQILAVDYYAPRVDGVLLSLGQFTVCGIISLIIMALTEHPVWSQIYDARVTLLYAGICSCGIAYTLQILGQQRVEPTKASLLMCLESPISVLAGWMILHQTLTVRELLGCAIMFAGILISQKSSETP